MAPGAVECGSMRRPASHSTQPGPAFTSWVPACQADETVPPRIREGVSHARVRTAAEPHVSVTGSFFASIMAMNASTPLRMLHELSQSRFSRSARDLQKKKSWRVCGGVQT
jgi:hypothetical protein